MVAALAPHGLHHVTAIAEDPQRNVDFYTTVLGLRLVKRTVNFDSPGNYHLYYGDESGRPSTLLTFFPWPGADAGRQGTGLTTATAFSIPPEALGWWQKRLKELKVDADDPVARADEEVLRLRDPDGLVIELVASDGDSRSGWDGASAVPADSAIRGLYSVTMTERELEPTAEMLAGMLGMEYGHNTADRTRLVMAGGQDGTAVDVLPSKDSRGLQAAGTVHHIAFRAPDQETQARWRLELLEAGINVTEILDRQYFTSIYFREPGGVLLEIATDQPGFTVDEPLLELGQHLKLPPWLEPNREQIENALPALRVPDAPR
ncbi:ring-cleaving dioxygenase [Streptomyces sp. SID13031]|uniref:ring-cleaving dioxygenase n=1 Tax=Streptomyces sp. SID13031 TaxID=2706046 RepID=UPI0013CBBFB0|nr:ring-cleaving dioxygenase [Streptomyces sp. SID13031]NEA31722.1 ring-cleaving dioxygenase [Streptomyces sp. SID13031]